MRTRHAAVIRPVHTSGSAAAPIPCTRRSQTGPDLTTHEMFKWGARRQAVAGEGSKPGIHPHCFYNGPVASGCRAARCCRPTSRTKREDRNSWPDVITINAPGRASVRIAMNSALTSTERRNITVAFQSGPCGEGPCSHRHARRLSRHHRSGAMARFLENPRHG